MSSALIQSLLLRLLSSFSYFFVFSRSFFLLSHSFRSFQLQDWTALTSTDKFFRSLAVPFNKSNEFVASKRSWEKTKNKLLEHLVRNINKCSSLRLSTFKTTYQTSRKLAFNCSLASSFIALFIAIDFKSDLSSKRWRLSLLTYRISSKNAETTSWAYRLLLRLHFLDIKSSTESSSQLSLQWFRLQISRISLQTSSSSRYLYSYQRPEGSKIARESILYASFISALRFLISSISKWRIRSSNCKYHDSCLAIRFRTEIRERFHLFFFVFVLTTNENRMHVSRFAEERTLLSYKRTRYLCIFQLS